ncbi:MAG: hypothetical protein AB1Z57_09385 [Acidimicrobiia bacterium]
MGDTTYVGRRPRGGRKTRQYGDDRRCTVPGCDVRLSRYNKHQVCSAHLPTFSRTRGRLTFEDVAVDPT